jgi:hypothetical protein
MSYRQPGPTSLMVVKSHTVARITLSVSALHNFVVMRRGHFAFRPALEV